jgi:RNA polymerase sigma-70 factor (ECF subfamily)
MGYSSDSEPGRLPSERAVWIAQHMLPLEPALRRWLKSRRFRGVDLDDVVQETYAVMAGLESVDTIRNVGAYVFSVAQSLIHRQLRRSQIVQITTLADIDRLGRADDVPSQESRLEHREELQRLADAIGQLPDRARAVFMLRKVEDLPQRQVAQRLGLSEGAVEKQLARSINILIRALGRGGDQGPSGSTGESNSKVEHQGHGSEGDRRRNR